MTYLYALAAWPLIAVIVTFAICRIICKSKARDRAGINGVFEA